MTTPTPTPIHPLIARCAALEEPALTLVRIMAVDYGLGVSLTNAQSLLRLKKFQTRQKRLYNPSDIKELFAPLVAQGLIVHSDRWRIAEPALADSIALELREQRKIASYLNLDERERRHYRPLSNSPQEDLLRLLREAILGIAPAWDQIVGHELFRKPAERAQVLGELFSGYSPIELLRYLPEPIHPHFISWYLDAALFSGTDTTSLEEWLWSQPADPQSLWAEPELLRALFQLRLLRQGEIDAAQLKWLEQIHPQIALEYRGCAAALSGQRTEAIALLSQAERLLSKRKAALLPGVAGIWQILFLILENSPANQPRLTSIKTALANANSDPQQRLLQQGISLFLDLSRNQPFETLLLELRLSPATFSNYYTSALFYHHLLFIWILRLFPECKAFYQKTHLSGLFAKSLLHSMAVSQSAGFHAYQRLLAQITPFFDPTAAPPAADRPDFIGWVSEREEWEQALDALLTLAPALEGRGGGSTAAEPSSRLIWSIGTPHPLQLDLVPKEQKRGKRGDWSKGRRLSLKRLRHDTASLADLLTDLDRQIATTLEEVVEQGWGYYAETYYQFDLQRALPLLAHHPHLYRELEGDRLIPLEIQIIQPELTIREQQQKLTLTLTPPLSKESEKLLLSDLDYLYFWPAENHLKVVLLTPKLEQLYTIIGRGLTIPKAMADRVRPVIDAVASLVTIHSDISSGGEIEQVEADGRLYLILRPQLDGLSLEMGVRPLGEQGLLLPPGNGGKTVVAEINGRRQEAQRNLKAESRAARHLIQQQLPILEEQPEHDWHWDLSDPELALTLVEQLQEIEPEQAVVVWPEGEKFRIKRRVSAAQFQIAISQERDWFALQGELAISDQEVLSMQQLLELIQQSDSRFLRLQSGDYLALSSVFRRQLQELQALSESGAKGKRLIHPLATGLVAELMEEVGEVKSSPAWKKSLERLQSLESYQPPLPSTLQTPLRDYQQEGFLWLARLAHWGVGGCLADDMGLGKTVQALALLLHRATGGPAMVVAPTSVCYNWVSETGRFAPTLTVKLYSAATDRQQLLEGLAPFDLLVVSYGLLQQDADLLTGRRYHTLILDEAQAIKNSSTKRSQAAMALESDFRLITTGTPVENHLSELWNLFRFINPGLLGSLERFNQRYAVPIERDDDPDARHRLKRLIQPFLLRRTKMEVLQELPPRTEITQLVEMEPEESAFYEALRRNALDQLERMNDQGLGHHQLEILAQITRLRRAVCNPKLVVKESPVGSPKLRAFAEIVTELLENHHKALVFSQFVDHLTLIREYLDGQGIHYQYLDGSTSVKARQERITAFQAGEGDLFLISLKAGGVGLNLTAADYVIHMDPWWNPAVEDQASDRAHRMGQKRPVTIYRLVVKGTIEEQIVRLHQTKRDLASNLIEGEEMGARLAPNDLLELLRQEAE